MDEEQEVLREAIDQSRAAGRGRWCCPQELRSRIATYGGRRRMAGASLAVIATEIGVSESSVARWATSPAPEPTAVQLREVQVDCAESTGSAGMVLITPRGYRLEGVSEAVALRLLREL